MSNEHLIKVKSALIWKPDWLMENLLSNEHQDILFNTKTNVILRNSYFESKQHIYYGNVFKLEVEEKLTREVKEPVVSTTETTEAKKDFQLRAWKYLVMRLAPLKDNNKTARNIFNYFTPPRECEIEDELVKSVSSSIKQEIKEDLEPEVNTKSSIKVL